MLFCKKSYTTPTTNPLFFSTRESKFYKFFKLSIKKVLKSLREEKHLQKSKLNELFIIEFVKRSIIIAKRCPEINYTSENLAFSTNKLLLKESMDY